MFLSLDVALPSEAHAVSIDVGRVTVPPGGAAEVSVALRTMGIEVVGTQNLIEFAPPVRIAARANGKPDCAVAPRIGKDATDFRFWPVGCAGDACRSVRAFVIAFDNTDPIPDGAVLYTCRVVVEAGAADGDYPLHNTGLGASDAAGLFVDADGSDGTVHVRRTSIRIDIDDAEAAPGDDVVVAVRLHSAGVPVVATQNRIDFTPPLRIAARGTGDPDCHVDPAIDKAATTFRFDPPDCTGLACTGVRAVVISFDNVAPIPDGAVLYTCTVAVDPAAEEGSYRLRNGEMAGSDAAAFLLPASGRDGTVAVVADDALVAIDIDEVRAVAGALATVGVRLESSPAAPVVAGTQNEIAFEPTAAIAATADGMPDCVVNPAIHKDGTSFLFLPPDCTPDRDCTAVRAFVLALDNTTPIDAGAVLYHCAVRVAPDAPVGIYPLENRNALAGDSDGYEVAARARHGRVEVICAGDCDRSGQVAIFELLRGVNILLGNVELTACGLFDSDDSGDVGVNEVVQSVSSALRGCRFDEGSAAPAPRAPRQ